MKLVTFRTAAEELKIGALIDEGRRIVDFSVVEPGNHATTPGFLRDMLVLIESGDDGLRIVRDYAAHAPDHACLERTGVTLMAPLPVPVQIRCFSVFEMHARQSGQAMMHYMASRSDDPDKTLSAMRASGKFDVPPVFYERPFYYKGNRMSVVGPDADVHWPPYSDVIDYEIELAAIIGRKGKDISAGDAGRHIFGYSVFNDLSARDEQAREMVAPLGPAKGKDFDGGNVLGPCIVTADEVGDPYALAMTVHVNGECWTESNSSGMTHGFEAMIAHVSRSETIHPGEIFLSGCAGGGCGMEQGRYPQRGDVVTLAIEKIGSLRNRIL